MRSFDWKYQPPEFKILWNYASALIAYTTITPLCGEHLIAGSEYLTYNAGKYYIALELAFSWDTSYVGPTTGNAVLYNVANAATFDVFNNNPVWDTTAAAMRYVSNPPQWKNLHFSRITVTTFIYIKFIGYRLNV